MAPVRLRIELLEPETFFVVDVDLKAAHVSSLATLADFIDKQIAHLDQFYRVDRTTLMVEWEDGVSGTDNVISSLDTVWRRCERAIVSGGAGQVTATGNDTGAQGEALHLIEETASSGPQLADVGKGKGNAGSSERDGKKDTRRSPAPKHERRTAEGNKTVEANGESDKQGPPLASVQTDNVIRETPGALGIGNWHMLPGSDSRRGSAIHAPVQTAPIADPFAAFVMDLNEPTTPTSGSQTVGMAPQNTRAPSIMGYDQWQHEANKHYLECVDREIDQHLRDHKHRMRVKPVPGSLIHDGESPASSQTPERVRRYRGCLPYPIEPNTSSETAIQDHERDGSTIRPEEPAASSKTPVKVYGDQGWGGGGVSPLSQGPDSSDQFGPSRGRGVDRGPLGDRTFGSLGGQGYQGHWRGQGHRDTRGGRGNRGRSGHRGRREDLVGTGHEEKQEGRDSVYDAGSENFGDDGRRGIPEPLEGDFYKDITGNLIGDASGSGGRVW